MKLNLCSYLIENKVRIIKTWKRYLESNPKSGPLRTISVYRDFLDEAHTEIVAMIHDANGKAWTSSPFRRPLCYYINIKSPSNLDYELCHNLYLAGLKAFQDILTNVEPPYEYYTEEELDLFSQRIKDAMQIIIHREINSYSDLNLNNNHSLNCPVHT